MSARSGRVQRRAECLNCMENTSCGKDVTRKAYFRKLMLENKADVTENKDEHFVNGKSVRLW